MSPSFLLAVVLASALPDHLDKVPVLGNMSVFDARNLLVHIPLRIKPDNHAPTPSEMARAIQSGSETPAAGTGIPKPTPVGYYISVTLLPLPPDPWMITAVVEFVVILILILMWFIRRPRPAPLPPR